MKPLCLAAIRSTTIGLTPTKGTRLGLEIDAFAHELLPPETADLDPAAGSDAGAGIRIAPLVAELDVKVRKRCLRL